MFLTFKDSEHDAKAALSPANTSFPAEPLVQWFCQETSLEKEYVSQSHANPSGHRYFCDNAFIDEEADISTVLEKALTTFPTKETYAFWYAMNPWSKKPLPDMALSLRTDHYLALYTICKDKGEDKTCENWVKDVMGVVKGYSHGSYIGDIDLQARTTKFWGNEQGAKLMELRRKWDPKGIICGYLDAGDQSGVTGLDNTLDSAQD